MNIKDQGIILSVKKYGESSVIVKIFSKENGIYSGFIRGAMGKKNSAIYQAGNLVEFTWTAKNSDNLGFFRVELIKSFLAEILSNQLKLNCLNIAISLIEANILEREPINDLFEKLLELQNSLVFGDEIFLRNYIEFEVLLLRVLGYGIDFSKCAVTETNEDLIFVSPKSARAVSRGAGWQYRDKLLKLPGFLIDDKIAANKDDLLAGLKLCEFFISKYLYQSESKNLAKNFPNFRLKLNSYLTL